MEVKTLPELNISKGNHGTFQQSCKSGHTTDDRHSISQWNQVIQNKGHARHWCNYSMITERDAGWIIKMLQLKFWKNDLKQMYMMQNVQKKLKVN